MQNKAGKLTQGLMHKIRDVNTFLIFANVHAWGSPMLLLLY